MWKDIGKAHGWRHPRAPSGKWLWKEKSTEAVSVYSRSTRVGCIGIRRKLPEERDESWHEGAGAGDEGEEGRPGPPGW